MKPEEMLRQLLGENDEVLREKIRQTAIAAGAGEAQAKKLSQDTEQVRRVLSGLKPSDLEGIIRAVGEDTVSQILSGVGSEGEKKD